MWRRQHRRYRECNSRFLDLNAQFSSIRGEIMAAVMEVLEGQHFILGPQVEEFEKEIARSVGCEFAIGCASGSDALLLALMALGVDAGDEVITTPYTFGATGGSIARLKARPVFVDIDPLTYNMDGRKLERRSPCARVRSCPCIYSGYPPR